MSMLHRNLGKRRKISARFSKSRSYSSSE